MLIGMFGETWAKGAGWNSKTKRRPWPWYWIWDPFAWNSII